MDKNNKRRIVYEVLKFKNYNAIVSNEGFKVGDSVFSKFANEEFVIHSAEAGVGFTKSLRAFTLAHCVKVVTDLDPSIQEDIIAANLKHGDKIILLDSENFKRSFYLWFACLTGLAVAGLIIIFCLIESRIPINPNFTISGKLAVLRLIVLIGAGVLATCSILSIFKYDKTDKDVN